MSICDECQLNGTVCLWTDTEGLEICKDFVRNPHSKYQHKQEPCGKFAETVLKIFDEEKALYKKKAEQYAQGDPLANFRGGAALEGLDPESLDDCFKVLLMYMAKHVAFLYQSGKLGAKEDESLGDVSVYSNIARAMWRMKKENK